MNIEKELIRSTIVYCDILNANEDIICHQVNCQGVMGSGLALQIKNKYPEVYESYKQGCAMFGSKKESLLGLAQMCKCNDGKIVCNLFGQLSYGNIKQHTDYKALSFALDSLFCGTSEGKYKGKTIAIPYKLGCGTGGGDWNTVLDIIEELAKFYNINVTIYKLED